MIDKQIIIFCTMNSERMGTVLLHSYSFISKGVFIVNYKEARNKYSINYMLKVLTIQWEKQKHVKLVNRKNKYVMTEDWRRRFSN